ncbi:MAG: alanyl-tRNA synthetase [Pyrinomonadaceae bacterium]
MKSDKPTNAKCPARSWTKRAGIIAFLFFLGKGLVWLGVAAVGAWYTFN